MELNNKNTPTLWKSKNIKDLDTFYLLNIQKTALLRTFVHKEIGQSKFSNVANDVLIFEINKELIRREKVIYATANAKPGSKPKSKPKSKKTDTKLDKNFI